MDDLTRTVSPLRQRMVEDLRMRKFEPKTQSGYLRAVRKLAAFLKASPPEFDIVRVEFSAPRRKKFFPDSHLAR